jgi:glycine C-acetyltransferase
MSDVGAQTTKQNPLQYVSEQLKELRAGGVAPKLRVLEGEQKPVCIFDGREVINLASNNYLGLTTHKALRKAALDAVKRYGAGAGAVRTIAGTMKIHVELEEQIAASNFGTSKQLTCGTTPFGVRNRIGAAAYGSEQARFTAKC